MRVRMIVAALAGAIGAVVVVSAGTQGAQEPNVLTALLTEVRGLRQAMEQMASAGPRVQLALGRLQLQEQRLNTMIRRLEGVHDSAAATERGLAQLQGELLRTQDQQKSAEERGDASDARALAYEITEMKRRMALVQQDVQRLQGEEGTLQQQIATEQGRWSEINRAIEDLERAKSKR